MGAKLRKVDEEAAVRYYEFYCPGCGHEHIFQVPRWTWNGSVTEPTFTPSLLCNPNVPERRCHLFVTKGMIVYLDDCYHSLKGQTVEMEDVRE